MIANHTKIYILMQSEKKKKLEITLLPTNYLQLKQTT